MNYRVGAYLVLAAMLPTGAAWAHHNMTVAYDLNNRITLSGTLTRFDWRNPHIELIVDTKGDKGQVETWTIEGPSPSFFRTHDIGKSDFEAAFGKAVIAEVSRARDSSQSGLLRVIKLPGGKVVSACPQNC